MMWRSIVLGVTAAVAIIGVACGDDDGTTAASTRVANTTAATPQQSPDATESGPWKTYESPAGFTIQYPPSWQVIIEDEPGEVKILDEPLQNESAQQGGARGTWVEIVPEALPYPPDAQPITCEASGAGASSDLRPVTFAGREVIRCATEGSDSLTGLGVHFVGYYIEQPAGKTLRISAYALQPDEATVGLLQQILDTVTFR